MREWLVSFYSLRRQRPIEASCSPKFYTCDMDGPPLRIMLGRGVVLPRIEKTEKINEAAKAANPNQRKAVTACASLQRLPILFEPLVMPLLSR